ncbi:SusC/RagA family TonB-linked outer membrane protein [Pedobacter steynii]|nr:SusC/RagA family TonB-linked outer membrane protein [Pedobacter steynii]NQX37771.1 SusC/RagA family TonB-linked outer membrane protein [Pedobacter steynii]
MRANLTTVLLISAIIQVSASSFAQKITLSEKNAPLMKVFRAIRAQTGYDFMLTARTLKGTKDITIEVKNAELNDVLKKIFEGQPLKYFVNDQTIIVSEKEGVGLSGKEKSLMDITVRGRVVDEKGEGLPGATVKLKGNESKVSIVTSSEGKFSINIPGENAVLIVSYVGYKTKEINVSGADVDLVIRLEPVTGQLEEVSVVSTGYQTIPKERSTGSFEKIDNALLNRSTGASILSRLENITPGLFVDRRLNSERAPGIGNISIRGLTTLTQAIATPLIIFDNFPYPGELENINPNDVESVTILKDAAAASIWGARAANGVIVITTKKGNYNRRTQVSFNTNLTVLEKPDLFTLKPMTASDYIDLEKTLFNNGFYNNKIDDIYTWPYLSPVVELMLNARQPGATISQEEADTQINTLRNHDVRNDYTKYVYRMGIAQQYALNINGGGNEFTYLLSGGFDNNRINVVKNQGQRITLRSAFAYKPISELEFEGGMFYTQSKDLASGNFSRLLYDPAVVLPYTRLANQDGNPLVVGRNYGVRFLDTADPRYLDWRYRPLAELDASSNTINTYDWLMNLGLNYKISKIFSASVKYQYGRTIAENTNLQRQESYYTRNLINLLTTFNGTEPKRNLPLGGVLGQFRGNNDAYNIRGQINASKTWNDKHQFDGLVGVEKSEKHLQSNSSTVYGYNEEVLTHADVDHLTQFISPVYSFVSLPSNIDINDQLYRFTSIFANAAYTYNSRYTISASGRKDAANLFGVNANLRGTPFWSTGISWDISKEPFYHFALMPFLKLRATYGYQGNTDSRLSAHSSIRYASANAYTISLPYADLINPANNDLRWERVGTLNLGIDFRSKDNVISGSIEYYKRHSKDVLNTTPLDYTTGFSSAIYNSSDLKGKGLDLSLHSLNLKGSFKWNTDLFLNYNSNKVTKYTPLNTDITNYINEGLAVSSGLIVGRPVYAIFSYGWAGLDPNSGDPMGYLNGEKSKDYTALTSVTPDQLQYHGSAIPIWSGAFRNTFTYKNISVSANIIGKFGHFFRRSSIDYGSLLNPNSTNIVGGHSDYALRWQKPGDESSTNVPSFIYPDDPLRDKFYAGSAILIDKADHIRLQDITLGYTLDRTSWAIKNVKIFANFSNLGIIWRANKLGLDPEFYRGYPAPRTIALGLNANF